MNNYRHSSNILQQGVIKLTDDPVTPVSYGEHRTLAG